MRPEELAAFAAETYPGVPEAANLLQASVDEAATADERERAAERLAILDREALLRRRAAQGGPALLEVDVWEEAAAKAVDVGKRAEVKGPVARSLAAFMSEIRNAPEPGWLVRELLPDEGIAIWHGRPRSMKSLTAEAVVLSLTLGEPYALQNPRFKIEGPVGSLYLGEEDSARLFGFRFGLMLKARSVLPGSEPEAFRIVVRPGWDLETPAGQAELLATIDATSKAMAASLRLLVVDPARASMPGIDGGPKDAARARAFLLTILRETSVKTILLPHHDLKPSRDGKDDRSRAERASGGVTFSMGDTMINFERLSDRECMAVPTAYKLGSDPKPFRVRFESETPSGRGFRGFLRTVAESTEEDAGIRDRVLALVQEKPWSSTGEVDRGAKLGTGEAARYLAQLESAGLVVSVSGAEAKARGRSTNAVLWGPK